jgi:hypothetical protein
MGIVGVGDKSDPARVQKCFGDDGIDQTHINSLMYLQIILDLDLGREKHRFALPDNFPAAWTDNPAFSITSDEPTPSSSADDDYNMMNSGGYIEINTSRIQESVSEAFDRIGFGHIDEYTLTMEDLAVDYNINMGAYPVELLSLDLANVQSKIGIELDGPGHFVTVIDTPEASRDEGYVLSNVGYYQMSKNGMWRYTFKWNWDTQEVNGATFLKSRVFAGLGWHLINIPFWSWLDLDGNSELEDKYCRSLLNKNNFSK